MTNPGSTNYNEGGGKLLLGLEEAVAARLLGLDYGAARIGVAIKHEASETVIPREVLRVGGEADAIAQVVALVRGQRPAGVVVGLPVDADPAQAREVRRFVRKARKQTAGVRWFFVDERLTTQAAESINPEQARRKPSDDLAAMLILQSFLEECRHARAQPTDDRQ
jgi:putative Holliday junction resolvase